MLHRKIYKNRKQQVSNKELQLPKQKTWNMPSITMRKLISLLIKEERMSVRLSVCVRVFVRDDK